MSLRILSQWISIIHSFEADYHYSWWYAMCRPPPISQMWGKWIILFPAGQANLVFLLQTPFLLHWRVQAGRTRKPLNTKELNVLLNTTGNLTRSLFLPPSSQPGPRLIIMQECWHVQGLHKQTGTFLKSRIYGRKACLIPKVSKNNHGFRETGLPSHMVTYWCKNAHPTSSFLMEAEPVQITIFKQVIWVYSQQCRLKYRAM